MISLSVIRRTFRCGLVPCFAGLALLALALTAGTGCRSPRGTNLNTTASLPLTTDDVVVILGWQFTKTDVPANPAGVSRRLEYVWEEKDKPPRALIGTVTARESPLLIVLSKVRPTSDPVEIHFGQHLSGRFDPYKDILYPPPSTNAVLKALPSPLPPGRHVVAVWTDTPGAGFDPGDTRFNGRLVVDYR